MNRQDHLTSKLNAAFSPHTLVVEDVSHQHAGHVGAQPQGQTHYTLHIVSAAFSGKTRVQRHRMIYDALAADIAAGVHALAITARAPEEL